MTTVKKAFALGAVLALMVPATAAAQAGTEGYGGPNEVIAASEDPGSHDPQSEQVTVQKTNSGTDGSLPFTGADLAVLASAGGLLLAFGFGLRRVTHRPSEA